MVSGRGGAAAAMYCCVLQDELRSIRSHSENTAFGSDTYCWRPKPIKPNCEVKVTYAYDVHFMPVSPKGCRSLFHMFMLSTVFFCSARQQNRTEQHHLSVPPSSLSSPDPPLLHPPPMATNTSKYTQCIHIIRCARPRSSAMTRQNPKLPKKTIKINRTRHVQAPSVWSSQRSFFCGVLFLTR